MTEFRRYAVYYAPRPGAFAKAAAEWLGRDPETDSTVVQPEIGGLDEDLSALTSKPRKYGFHGTLRAPFRLASGVSEASVVDVITDLAAELSPARCEVLSVQNRYGFGLALTPASDESEIIELGARVVERTNHLRAPLMPTEVDLREAEGMTSRQRELLEHWGYPRVMEELSFQLTLTNAISPHVQPILSCAIERHFTRSMPRPFMIEDLCLFGEETLSGNFRLLQRIPLRG